eukprot:TRINITY_DN66397_c0_g1_i1.p1 TRINITY_DN66397_c0_g1~~TRINITY_DN66397_c0_g1_i1.p1  ORF type:complete len:563 (+),score=190.99 TRINITY_DN66397_c0_g1_i1:49-1689(+)
MGKRTEPHNGGLDVPDAKRGAAGPSGPTADYLGMMLKCPAGDVTRQTPLQRARILSEKAQCDVYLKREDTQLGFSQHLRTAYTLVAGLTAEQRRGHVVATGIGNFAYTVCLACASLGLKDLSLTLVLPSTASPLQFEQLAQFREGSDIAIDVITDGVSQTHSHAKALQIVSELESAKGSGVVTLLQNTKGDAVIGASGSIAVELFRELPQEADVVYVGVGSGSLAAALAEYAATIHPDTTIVAVEAEGNCAMSQSIAKGELVQITGPLNTFAEGTAVDEPNPQAFGILKKRHAEGTVVFMTVSNDDLCASIKSLFLDTRAILEPSGVLAVAGVKSHALDGRLKDKTVAAVVGSANMEFTSLRCIAERSEENELLVTVNLPEEIGAFRRMYSNVYPLAVTEFSYRYNAGGGAVVFMSFQIPDKRTGEAVVQKLNSEGFPCTSLHDNEMAKAHARYLVGGRGAPPDERLFRFQFPENMDALLHFLSSLPPFANITLFHYRNHGADYGKVLVGFDIPTESEIQFQTFLATVSYDYTDETSNPVYRLFLR